MSTIDTGLQMIRTASQRVSAVNDRMSGKLKSWMPTGLYARALLIMIVPMVVLQSVVAFGPYVFHLERGELRQGEEIIHLTDREREMLRILSSSPGETVPRAALTSGGTVNERAVDVQINRLRRKIERDPANPLFLQAVRGIGYRLVAAP